MKKPRAKGAQVPLVICTDTLRVLGERGPQQLTKATWRSVLEVLVRLVA